MTIKKIIVFLACLILLAAPAYATDYYPATSLTGGGTGALDAIDGSDLESGDVAIVTTSSATYHYRMDSTSGAAESSPGVISPDTNAGTKRWLLVGIYGATFQGATGVQVTGVSNDTDLSGDSETEAITEHAAYTYISTQIAAVAAISNFAGYVERPKFEYKDTDEIYINPGRYEHNGTAQQVVSWDSQLTFQFGPGGSNAGSSALAASDWFYLYIDDSAVVTAGTNLLTASEFIAVTTAPTWNNSKYGFYSGTDRCIAAFITNASSQIIAFWHDGGDLIFYDEPFTDRAMADVDTTPTDVTLTLPAFCTKGLVSFQGYGGGTATYEQLYWRTNGSSSSVGNVALYSAGSLYSAAPAAPVISDSSGVIEIWYDASGAHQARVVTNGYYLPGGM